MHGEFGTAQEWLNSYEASVAGWLQQPANRPILEEILYALTPQTEMVNDSGFVQRVLDFIQKELSTKITEIARSPSYTQDALSERLANAGLLPMFGFPTRVRLLYTRWPSANPWPPETDIVDRDLEVAISQFAPGSQTVKDKAVYNCMWCVPSYFRLAANIYKQNPGSIRR